MQTVITGCGRSGTNLLLEIVRASGLKGFTKEVEDRNFFLYELLPEDYGSKIAIEWDSMNIESMAGTMNINPRLKILFSFRHPYDVVLSKIYRGRPKSQGGDNMTEDWAKDANIDEAIKYINKSWVIYERLATFYPERVLPIKMEDIILNTARTVNFICGFLKIARQPKMTEPWKFTRNRYHNKRYHHQVDKKEINKWKDLKNNYSRFFKDIGLKQINQLIEEQAKYFNYELI